MKTKGWIVAPARREQDPDQDFHVWQEDQPGNGRFHAVWIADSMLRRLTAEQLVAVLERERVFNDVRVSFQVRIEERGAEYRVSPVPRRSGEVRRVE